MRVVNNRALIRNRALFGRWTTIVGFLSLFAGLFYSLPFFWSTARDYQAITISYGGLILGYVLITLGRGPWLRFSVHPRPDEALALNLKTMDARTLLLNYVRAVPVDHLLYNPAGLLVLETRPFIGDITVRGDRWRRQRSLVGWLQLFSEGALGNPTRDALRGVELMKAWLVEHLGAEAAEKVPVEPLIVFTHPRVTLTIDEPTVPVVHARDSREVVRKLLSGPKMPGDVARRLELLLVEEAKPDGDPVAAGEAVDRKPRRRRAAKAR